MTRTTIVIAAALAFAAVLPAAPALAQRARIFVASYGSDSNPCTFGSPCKTFQQAVNVVAAGGEVTAIDSAGFQPVTIGKSVTITSPAGIEAGVAAPASSAAITISAGADDVVSLHGLTLEGADVSGASGINVDSVGNLDVIDCVIRDYSNGTGLKVETSSQTTITISNSYFSNNFYGVLIQSAWQLGSSYPRYIRTTISPGAVGSCLTGLMWSTYTARQQRISIASSGAKSTPIFRFKRLTSLTSLSISRPPKHLD
jgi:hypothetical protein